MAYFKRKPTKKNEGKIIYCKGIVEDIVLLAMKEVPFVELQAKKKIKKNLYNAISVDYNKDGVVIDLSVKIHQSQRISDIAFKIQEIIRREVESMTEYRVIAVNINVIDVSMRNEPVNAAATAKQVAENTQQKENVATQENNQEVSKQQAEQTVIEEDK